MRCPSCNEEMEKGLLQTGQILLWAKRRHKISLLPGEGEVLLAKDYLRGIALEAFICKKCRKVIFEYGSREDDR